MTFSSKVTLPFLYVFLDCGVDSLCHYLQRAVGCQCQVTTLWFEFINAASLFAPVYLAGGWEKEKQLQVCSAPTELKRGTAPSVLSTY